MKKNFHRVVSLLLALMMAVSLAVSAAAEYGEEEDAVTGGMIPAGLHNFMRVNTYKEDQYSDVPATHTFSENAKAAYEFDIMQGYGTTFGVSNNITRLASIIIACRLNCIYYEGENRIDEAYSGTTQERYMAYARDFGILCDFDDVSKSATRAEFAAILASAFPEDALKAINTVEDNAIPDVSATAKYADAIYRLYRAGILNGSDAKGTFYPASNINRGAACAIATRMCDESLRKSVNLTKTETETNTDAPITIYEGEDSPRPAKAGDTYVKADGTKVVLKIGPNGVLGEGQGVAPDANLSVAKGTTATSNFNNSGVFTYNRTQIGVLTDSLGNDLQNQRYCINQVTGEGHWYSEWLALEDVYPSPKSNGSTNGQISSDPYSLYFWHVRSGSWRTNY